MSKETSYSRNQSEKPVSESNYLLEFLWVQTILGDIATKILVNAHKFNSVCPDEMDTQVKEVTDRLLQMSERYRQQWRLTDFSIER